MRTDRSLARVALVAVLSAAAPAAAQTDAQLPAGHPPMTGTQTVPDVAEPDVGRVDDALAPGTIVVEVRDGTDRPLADVDVQLGIVQQSISKGESRRRISAKSDAEGVARFEGLATGSGGHRI